MTKLYYFLTIIPCCLILYVYNIMYLIGLIILFCCCLVYYIYFRYNDFKLEFIDPYCEKGGRDENQDHIGRISIRGMHCFVIADGLGGHRGGKRAAEIAVNTILENFSKFIKNSTSQTSIDESVNIFLTNSLHKAHHKIKEESNAKPECKNMKTTCVVLVVIKNIAYFTNIGDSRIYFIKNGEVVQKSKDHSVVQVLLDMNEISEKEIKGHPDRNRVLKALGIEDDLAIHTLNRKIDKGEYILLCTDGFWEYFTVKEMELFFQRNCELSIKDLLDNLYNSAIDKAKKFDEHYDNITIQLIKVV